MIRPEILWTAAGVVVGIWHASKLWQSARRIRQPSAAVFMRLPVVGALLVVSALAGYILWTAAGWAAGLASAAIWIWMRREP